MNPDTFWVITPREMNWRMEGAIRRNKLLHNEGAWRVWHTAAFIRSNKKLPELKTLLMGSKKKKTGQSWQEQLVIVKGWSASHNAALAHNASLGKR